MQTNVLKLNPNDNVIVALTQLRKGDQIPFAGDTYTLMSDIPAKHKFVTRDVQPGDEIRMYGLLVGTATQPIQRVTALQKTFATLRRISICPTGLRNGTRLTAANSSTEHFWAITAVMARWEPAIIGW